MMKLNGVLVGVSLLVTFGATAACGGDDGDGGGKAGSGSAGSATQAGSGGSSSGGSASQAGTATGVSGSVGTAGSSAGGTSAGGTSAGGTSAGGGDCTVLCAKATVKACMGDSCVAACTQARQLFLGFFPQCSAEWDALSACVVKQPNENVMCEDDIVSSPACATEQAALDACGS